MKTISNSSDQLLIRNLINEQCLALEKKDMEKVVSFYTDDSIVYELDPPLLHKEGHVETVKGLKQWADGWKSAIKSEIKDLDISVGGDVAFAYGLKHMTGTKKDGVKVDLWHRATICLRKIDDHWKIVHEHMSVPFLMDGSDKAALDLKPN